MSVEGILRPSITYRQAVMHLRSLARAYPDRVTKDFGYFDEQLRPQCIMAHLMEMFGADAARVREYSKDNLNPNIRVLIDDYGVMYADLETVTLLQHVQTIEDSGKTWSEAIYGGETWSEEIYYVTGKE